MAKKGFSSLNEGLIQPEPAQLPTQAESQHGTRELAPEQIAFIQTLKTRYAIYTKKRLDELGVDWAAVEQRLADYPGILDVLSKPESQGMEPCLVGVDDQGKLIFSEITGRVPDKSSRRNVTAQDARNYVAREGGHTSLTSAAQYRSLIEEFLIEMDDHDLTWVDENGSIIAEQGRSLGAFKQGWSPVAVVIEREDDYKDPLTVFRCTYTL